MGSSKRGPRLTSKKPMSEEGFRRIVSVDASPTSSTECADLFTEFGSSARSGSRSSKKKTGSSRSLLKSSARAVPSLRKLIMEGMPRFPLISPDLKQAASEFDDKFILQIKEYILIHFQADPSSYDEALQEIKTLKREVIRGHTDIEAACVLKRYYAQLLMMKNRFPLENSEIISTSYTWFDRSAEIGSPNSSDDVNFELACTMFQVGAVHASIGAEEPRITEDSIKNAFMHFQYAAWPFQHLRDKMDIHKFQTGDFDKDILTFYVNILLGQAQECLVLKSLLDNRTKVVVAKLSAYLRDLYKECYRHLFDSNITDLVPSSRFKTWQNFCIIKSELYGSLAMLYMGLKAEDDQKFGERIVEFMVVIVESDAVTVLSICRILLTRSEDVNADREKRLDRLLESPTEIVVLPVPTSAASAVSVSDTMTASMICKQTTMKWLEDSIERELSRKLKDQTRKTSDRRRSPSSLLLTTPLEMSVDYHHFQYPSVVNKSMGYQSLSPTGYDNIQPNRATKSRSAGDNRSYVRLDDVRRTVSEAHLSFPKNVYSRKVFIGGLPSDVDREHTEMMFAQFGNVTVDWPREPSYIKQNKLPPTLNGYVFLVYDSEVSVHWLVKECIEVRGQLWLNIPCPKTFKKAGAARVTFATMDAYRKALDVRFVKLDKVESSKREVEIKPYIMDDQPRDECNKMHYSEFGERRFHRPSVRMGEQTKELSVPHGSYADCDESPSRRSLFAGNHGQEYGRRSFNSSISEETSVN